VGDVDEVRGRQEQAPWADSVVHALVGHGPASAEDDGDLLRGVQVGSWQVVPKQLNEMLESVDRDAAARAMKAMLDMMKIDIQELRAAYEGRAASTAAS
jgi:hypothetical protein